jgi:hypothetical protein
MNITLVGGELLHEDRHDEANSRFSQFCERAYKNKRKHRSYKPRFYFLIQYKYSLQNKIHYMTEKNTMGTVPYSTKAKTTSKDEGQTALFKDPVRTAQ